MSTTAAEPADQRARGGGGKVRTRELKHPCSPRCALTTGAGGGGERLGQGSSSGEKKPGGTRDKSRPARPRHPCSPRCALTTFAVNHLKKLSNPILTNSPRMRRTVLACLLGEAGGYLFMDFVEVEVYSTCEGAIGAPLCPLCPLPPASAHNDARTTRHTHANLAARGSLGASYRVGNPNSVNFAIANLSQ